MKGSVTLSTMMTTLINFYIGVARLTVLLPFTVIRAWKLSMEYPDYLDDDQIYEDEENSWFLRDDPESKLALSEVEADSSFEDDHGKDLSSFIGWGSEIKDADDDDVGDLAFSWLWNWGWPREYKETSSWGVWTTKQEDKQDSWTPSWNRDRENKQSNWGWGSSNQSEKGWTWGAGSRQEDDNQTRSGWNWSSWGREQEVEDVGGWNWGGLSGRSGTTPKESKGLDWTGSRWKKDGNSGLTKGKSNEADTWGWKTRSQSLHRVSSPSRQELARAENQFREEEQRRSASQPNIKYKTRSQSPEAYQRHMRPKSTEKTPRNIRSRSRSLSPRYEERMNAPTPEPWNWWGTLTQPSSGQWTDQDSETRSRRSRSGSPTKPQDRTRSKALRRWETRDNEKDETPEPEEQSQHQENRGGFFSWPWNSWQEADSSSWQQDADKQFVDYDVDDEMLQSADDKQRLVSFVQQEEDRLSREKSSSPGPSSDKRRGILRTRSPTVKSIKVAELKQRKELERQQRADRAAAAIAEKAAAIVDRKIREAADGDTDSTVNDDVKPVRTLIDRWNKHVQDKEALKLSFKVAKKLSPKMSRKISPRGSFSRSARLSLVSPRHSLSNSPRSSVRISPRSSYKTVRRERTSLADLTARFKEKYGKGGNKDNCDVTNSTSSITTVISRDDSPAPTTPSTKVTISTELETSGSIPPPPPTNLLPTYSPISNTKNLKPLSPSKLPIPVSSTTKFKIESKAVSRPIEQLNKELLEKVSQRLDFSRRRESLSVSKLKQKFEQPETHEFAKADVESAKPNDDLEPIAPPQIVRKVSIGALVNAQNSWIQDSSEKLEKIEQTVDKLSTLVMSNHQRDASTEQTNSNTTNKEEDQSIDEEADTMLIIDKIINNIDEETENQKNTGSEENSVEEGIEAAEEILENISEENSGEDTDEGNLDITPCVDTGDSPMAMSSDEVGDEPSSTQLQANATVHYTQPDFEAQERKLDELATGEEENVREDVTVESAFTLPPIHTIDNLVTDNIEEEGVTDVLHRRDDNSTGEDLDKIQVVQVMQDSNKEKRLEKKIGNLSKLKSKIFPRKEISSFQKNLSSSLESLVINAPSADIYRSVSRISLSGGEAYDNNLYQPSFSRSEIVLKVDSGKGKCDCKVSSSESPKRFGRKRGSSGGGGHGVESRHNNSTTTREFISSIFKERVLRDFWSITQREEAYLEARRASPSSSDSE